MTGRLLSLGVSASVMLAAASGSVMAAPSTVIASDGDCRVSVGSDRRRDDLRSRGRAYVRKAPVRRSSSARSSIRLSSSYGPAPRSVAVAASSDGRGRTTTITQTNNGCSIVTDEGIRKGAPR